MEGTINCTAKKKVALTETWHKDIRLKLHTGILFLKGGIELRVRLVTDQSVKGGPPPVCNQNLGLFRKEKNKQNVLKRKMCILVTKIAQYVYLNLFYV